MSEGFAEYLALRASEEREGSTQHEQRNYWAYLNLVPSDVGVPIQGTAVRTSPFAYEMLYLKASAFLSLLERHIGRQRFDRLLREYVELFAYSNTTTEEFLDFLQARAPSGELERLFNAWVYTPGHLDTRSSTTRSPGSPSILSRSEVDDPFSRMRPLELPIRQTGSVDTSEYSPSIFRRL